ncbi:MAG: histidine phosphatase family protein [Phototrophicaceae bacterium]
MYLYVIRHGQSHINIAKWDTLDTMDTALTEKGQQQAQALHDWLIANNRQCDALYTSTMRRTQETARYIEKAFQMDAIPDDRIREIGNSDLDGRALSENDLPQQFNPLKANQAPFAARGIDVENGESWMHFRTRIGQFVDGLLTKYQGRRVYVVAHGGVISAMLENIYNTGPYRHARSDTHNTGWSLFEHQGQQASAAWVVRHHNRIDHLHDTDLL